MYRFWQLRTSEQPTYSWPWERHLAPWLILGLGNGHSKAEAHLGQPPCWILLGLVYPGSSRPYLFLRQSPDLAAVFRFAFGFSYLAASANQRAVLCNQSEPVWWRQHAENKCITFYNQKLTQNKYIGVARKLTVASTFRAKLSYLYIPVSYFIGNIWYCLSVKTLHKYSYNCTMGLAFC